MLDCFQLSTIKVKGSNYLMRQKVLKTTNSILGFSLVEVILATAIFTIMAVSGVTIILHSFSVNKLGEEESNAHLYAQEGIEAVRSIKNRAWGNLTAGTYGLATTGNQWNFLGTSDTKLKYTRAVIISSVNRDGLGNIVDSGGTIDPDTMKVTTNVNWDFSEARTGNNISLVTYLSNFRKAIATGGPIMMAYSKTTSTPFYRTWDGSSWSAEGSAQTVGGNINYVVLKSSRTRNEAILGTLDANDNIYVQVWNGTSWGTPTLISTGLAAYRGFDIEYEKSGDRAMIVYLPNSTSTDPAYRVWDGVSWSSATTITTPPTTGVVRWVELAQNPGSSSNEIAMIMLDANIDVYGMVWNGSSWGNMGTAAVWDATAAIATEKVIDVAYEQTSGRAMFIWGDSVATDQYYRIWNGSTLTSATLLDIATSGNVANWIELVSRPSSNELMYGVLDGGSDLNTRTWSGSAWDTATQHPEHTAGAENNSSMVFDLVWETHSSNLGKAWLLWGNGSAISKKQWTTGTPTPWGSATTLTGSDDTSFIRLKADPSSGTIFAGIYESAASVTDDIWESRLTGGGTTWSAENTIWGGPISAEPVYFRVDIAIP